MKKPRTKPLYNYKELLVLMKEFWKQADHKGFAVIGKVIEQDVIFYPEHELRILRDTLLHFTK